MPQKTPPFTNYPMWTEARFWGFIRSGLREKFNRYPPKYETLKKAANLEVVTDLDGNPIRYKTGMRAGEIKKHKLYTCNMCKQKFKQAEVQVDHIVPAGTLKSFADLPEFVRKLFCGEDGLQVLCKGCHAIKTQEDKEKSSE